jgi:pyrroline-5-carboxylate reductase
MKKIGFIGAGNLAQAMIRAWLESGKIHKENIFASSRTEARLSKVVEKFGIQACSSNEQLVQKVDIVILATKPQDLAGAVEAVAMEFEDKLVVSLAAGFTLDKLKKLIPYTKQLVRVMANTPIKIGKGVVGYTMTDEASLYENQIRSILEPLGIVLSMTDGDAFRALTIASASGTGFVLELMQYWQDWIEGYGVDAHTAKEITIHTFLGTACLAERQNQQTFEELQSSVVSKKGTTAAGLDSIRENDVERVLRLSFEKAALRDSELSELV